MRQLEKTAKSVDEAVRAACEELGVARDDVNVSYEVLEFPERKFFRTIPAKVRVTVSDPEPNEVGLPLAEATEPAAKPAQPAQVPNAGKSQPQEPQPEPMPAPTAAAPQKTLEVQAPAEKPAARPDEKPADREPSATGAEETEGQTIDLSRDARLQAAVDYLVPIAKLLGAENVTITGCKRGETIVLCVEGDNLGALIGRRGETMESLSYLTSLAANRCEGGYIKLGIDVGGYRAKREADLKNLAQRIGARVRRTGYSYELEPMNPYERHVIHSAVSELEGVRSESKGEGTDRRVVIYSTDPSASNLPDRGGYRPGKSNWDREPRYDNRGTSYRGSRGGYRYDTRERPQRTERRGRYARSSGAPQREYADRAYDPDSTPTVPDRTERIHDGDEFAFGRIEL